MRLVVADGPEPAPRPPGWQTLSELVLAASDLLDEDVTVYAPEDDGAVTGIDASLSEAPVGGPVKWLPHARVTIDMSGKVVGSTQERVETTYYVTDMVVSGVHVEDAI